MTTDATPTNPTSNAPADEAPDPVAELHERARRIRTELGGREAVDRLHARGERTIREHIDGLLDPGTFEELGTTLIKLGQLISTRPDVFPPAYCRAFARLTDSTQPVPNMENKRTS